LTIGGPEEGQEAMVAIVTLEVHIEIVGSLGEEGVDLGHVLVCAALVVGRHSEP